MAALRGLMVPRHRHDASTDGIATTRAVSLQVIEFTAFLGQEVWARLGEFGCTAGSLGIGRHTGCCAYPVPRDPTASVKLA